MKARLLNHRLGDLLHQRNFLFSLVAALLLLNFTQAILVLFKSERVVVVPPEVKREFWLEKNQVSAGYLEEMALFFADLILESSPESTTYMREIILRNTVAQGYGALKSRLLEDERRIKKDRVVTSFRPNSVKVNSSRLIVTILGDLMSFVGEKRISQSRDTYQFQFVYQHGRLLIQTFKLIRSEHNG